MILFLFIISAAKHEAIIGSIFEFFSIAIDDSCDFLIEDTIVDVCLLGVEVFVKRSPDDAIRIDCDAEFLG